MGFPGQAKSALDISSELSNAPLSWNEVRFLEKFLRPTFFVRKSGNKVYLITTSKFLRMSAFFGKVNNFRLVRYWK